MPGGKTQDSVKFGYSVLGQMQVLHQFLPLAALLGWQGEAASHYNCKLPGKIINKASLELEPRSEGESILLCSQEWEQLLAFNL